MRTHKRDGVYAYKYNGKTKSSSRYRACITVNFKKIHLGYFGDEISALAAREIAEEKYNICRFFASNHKFNKEDYLYLFDYDEKSGRLINKVTRKNGAAEGLFADNSLDQGYRVVTLQGRHIKAHRIIWSMINGDIKERYEIDHINRIRDDNRIANLRMVTHQENQMNVGRRIDCKFVTGVIFIQRDKVWRADIGVNKKRLFLGEFKDKNSALLARKSAEIKYGFLGER